MKTIHSTRGVRPPPSLRLNLARGFRAALLAVLVSCSSTAWAATILGTTLEEYAVLASSTVTNTNQTRITNFDTSAGLTGDLVLDASSDPDGLFVFQIGKGTYSRKPQLPSPPG